MITSHKLRRSSLALGLVLALAAGGTPAVALAQAKAQAQTPAKPAAAVTVTQADRNDFRAGMRSSGETIGLLMDTYPEEYAAFETKIITGIKSGTMDMPALQALTAQWAMTLRARLASNISKASDADLVNIGRTQMDVMRQLSTTHPAACSEFIELGGLSPTTAAALDDTARLKVDKLGVLQMRTAATALKTPMERTAITEAEAGPVLKAFAKKGGDLKWLVAAGNPPALASFTGQARCANALYWIETVLEQPAPLAARLLAK